MKNKLISIFTKSIMSALIAVLLVTLFLNVSTLMSIEKINCGQFVKSGYFCAIISSGSMEPAVSINDLLFINGCEFYQPEDIVTYVSRSGSLITHRIKEVTDRGYITQGDANNIPDEIVFAQSVLGKTVFVLPGVGGIIDGILSPVGIVLLAIILLVLCLIQRINEEQNENKRNYSKNTFNSTS